MEQEGASGGENGRNVDEGICVKVQEVYSLQATVWKSSFKKRGITLSTCRLSSAVSFLQ